MDQRPLDMGRFVVEHFDLSNQHQEAIDLRSKVISFDLYESIYKKFVHGQVLIGDAQDLIKNLRITGQEFLHIKLSQKEAFGEQAEDIFSIDKNFRIYAIENVDRSKDGQRLTQSYWMKIISPRAYTCANTRIQKVFRGSWSNILQRVLLDEVGMAKEEIDHWEPTEKSNYQFVCPNWTSGEMIDWCVSNASPHEKDGDGFRNSFFFFESMNGKFQFKSFKEMCDSQFPVNFDFTPRVFDDPSDMPPLNASGGLNSQIIGYMKPNVFNTFEGMKNGAYASEMLVYDPTIKLMSSRVFNLADMYKEKIVDGKPQKSAHVSGSYPMISLEDEIWQTTSPSISDTVPPSLKKLYNVTELNLTKQFPANVVYDINMAHAFDNEEHGKKEAFTGIVNGDARRLERKALLEILQQNKILVKIPFRTDIRAGNKIQLDLGHAQKADSKTKSDELNDGLYLITAIVFNGSTIRTQGTLTLTCVKESFAKNVKDVKPLDSITAAEVEG